MSVFYKACCSVSVTVATRNTDKSSHDDEKAGYMMLKVGNTMPPKNIIFQ